MRELSDGVTHIGEVGAISTAQVTSRCLDPLTPGYQDHAPPTRVLTHMMSAWASRDRLDPESRRMPRSPAGLLCLTPGPAREYGAAARLA
jgi:hypothetical protein